MKILQWNWNWCTIHCGKGKVSKRIFCKINSRKTSNSLPHIIISSNQFMYIESFSLTSFLRQNRGSKILQFPQSTMQCRFFNNSIHWNLTRIEWNSKIDFTKFFIVRECTLPHSQCGKTRNSLPAVWKLLGFSPTHFWQKFRESNVFTKEITKELIWRNIFWWD